MENLVAASIFMSHKDTKVFMNLRRLLSKSEKNYRRKEPGTLIDINRRRILGRIYHIQPDGSPATATGKFRKVEAIPQKCVQPSILGSIPLSCILIIFGILVKRHST